MLYLWVYLHLWITCDYLWLFVVVNEPTSDSEVYLYLCVVDISIWTACDAYCELSVMDVMFIWMWYVVVTETNKLIICGSFAECNTPQKPYLPSAMKIHSAKRDTWQKSVLSGTKMASFAECLCCDTRQRSHFSPRKHIFLPRVSLCRVYFHGTRQIGFLSSVTLGKAATYNQFIWFGHNHVPHSNKHNIHHR